MLFTKPKGFSAAARDGIVLWAVFTAFTSLFTPNESEKVQRKNDKHETKFFDVNRPQGIFPFHRKYAIEVVERLSLLALKITL